MTEIKICGMTRGEDALFAVSCGVDALGFIFYAPSPRYVTPEAARLIISALPIEVIKVGVFVNQDAREVRQIFDFCSLDLIQLHGDETPDYCGNFLPTQLIKAVSLNSEADLVTLATYPVRALLVDSRTAAYYGGTGMRANWELAARVRQSYGLVLSGGLSENNIAAALAEVSPPAVDINSGVESSPGRKDHEKVRRIVEMIRSKDDELGERKIFYK